MLQWLRRRIALWLFPDLEQRLQCTASLSQVLESDLRATKQDVAALATDLNALRNRLTDQHTPARSGEPRRMAGWAATRAALEARPLERKSA
jgi:hypothetical protein